MKSNKKAAMEMSVGTIVTIVLMMTVLVLGLVMIRSIFSSGTNAIDDIDSAIQNEINKLFAEEGKPIVVYPSSREIELKKGKDGGFGFSIKNIEQTDGTFSYTVTAAEVSSGCQMTLEQANNLIILGKGNTIGPIPSGSIMNDAVLVKYEIPETASICSVRYNLQVQKDGQAYTSPIGVDLKIK